MRSQRTSRRAAELERRVGEDIQLARAIIGITRKRAARIAGISHTTLAAIEDGWSMSRIDTLVAGCDAVELSLSVKAYPGRPIGLRDSGQLTLVELLQRRAHPTWRSATELVVDVRNGRAADLVLYGPDEILHVEVERRIVDWQAQSRSARVKQAALADQHQRPVHLVVAIEGTQRNRTMMNPLLPSIRRDFPVAHATSGRRWGAGNDSDVTPWSGCAAGRLSGAGIGQLPAPSDARGPRRGVTHAPR